MIATHSRYSFHTGADGKGSFINDIEEHRYPVDGHHYWVLRMNPADAAQRGLAQHALVKVYNDRGAVICAADISDAVMPGVVKSFEASAEYQPVFVDGEWVDIGGSLNTLTSSRPQQKRTSSMSPNSCLVQVAAWTPARRQSAAV
jgi:trimethylamine-N-oxide reductase (cytochrome c)